MRFKYVNNLINSLADRQVEYVKQRDLLLSQRKASNIEARIAQALSYEQLVARITELDLVIDNLVHALNLEQIEHDRRKNDRRKKKIIA